MGDFWENKYLSSERSIQFIQSAHAEILKGLHSEIESLQKQCSDYALRLSLQASTTAEKEEYDKKFKSYNAEYKKKDSLLSEQKKLIDERNKNIKTLEDRVKSLEKKYELDLTGRDQLVKQYKTQLDSQSAQIANLTYQIHHLSKLKTNSNQINDPKATNLNLNESTEYQQQPSPIKNLNSPKMSKTSKSSRPLNNEVASIKENEVSLASSNNQFMQAAMSTKMSKNKSSNERKQSDELEQQSNMPQLLENELLNSGNEMEYQYRRSVSSNSNSARSDRSSTPPVNKHLPPVIKRASDLMAPPDPKPFLLSAASTLHSRNRKEYLQRKTLISLPPIKPFELNQLAVESPLKIGHNKSSLLNDQNNQPSI